MSKNLEIGDHVKLEDGEECIVKYAYDNGTFLDEINEIHVFDDTCEIIKKNDELKNLSEFTTLEKEILLFFDGGENKGKMYDSFSNEKYSKRELDFIFKQLVNNGYLNSLFQNKYISKIKNKMVVKVK